MNDATWKILREIADSANGDTATFDQLAEEVMELHLAMRGKHAHTPAMEWLEIATIAMNAFASYLPIRQRDALDAWRQKHLPGAQP
jgi:hypothetical protein